jgi:hypothetical protein
MFANSARTEVISPRLPASSSNFLVFARGNAPIDAEAPLSAWALLAIYSDSSLLFVSVIFSMYLES